MRAFAIVLLAALLGTSVSGCLVATVMGEPDYRFGAKLDAGDGERATSLHGITVPEGTLRLQMRAGYRFDAPFGTVMRPEGSDGSRTESTGPGSSEAWFLRGSRSAMVDPQPGPWEVGFFTAGRGSYDLAIYLCSVGDARPACGTGE